MSNRQIAIVGGLGIECTRALVRDIWLICASPALKLYEVSLDGKVTVD